jgi:hypothetical protein
VPTVDEHCGGKPGLRARYDALVALGEAFGPAGQDSKQTSNRRNRKAAFAGMTSASAPRTGSC